MVETSSSSCLVVEIHAHGSGLAIWRISNFDKKKDSISLQDLPRKQVTHQPISPKLKLRVAFFLTTYLPHKTPKIPPPPPPAPQQQPKKKRFPLRKNPWMLRSMDRSHHRIRDRSPKVPFWVFGLVKSSPFLGIDLFVSRVFFGRQKTWKQQKSEKFSPRFLRFRESPRTKGFEKELYYLLAA